MLTLTNIVKIEIGQSSLWFKRFTWTGLQILIVVSMCVQQGELCSEHNDLTYLKQEPRVLVVSKKSLGSLLRFSFTSRWVPDEPRHLFRKPEREVHQQWLEQGSSESDSPQHPIHSTSWPRQPPVRTGDQCGPEEQLWQQQRAWSGGRVGRVSDEQRLLQQVQTSGWIKLLCSF